MCWREQTGSSNDFGSTIVDFGLWERKRMNKKTCLRFLNSHSDNLKSKSGPKDENLKSLALSVIAFVLVLSAAVAHAQQPTKIPRIGFLAATKPAAVAARAAAFPEGLREGCFVDRQK